MDSKVTRTDVVVIGGGAAGLSGALMLARSRRRVVVVDAGEPRNAPADGVHGLLARDGTPPRELLSAGREEVRRYGGTVLNGRVVRVVATGSPGSGSSGSGSSGSGPDGLAPDGLAPDRLGPDGLGPDGLGPDGLGPDRFARDGLGPDGLAPDRLGRDRLGANGFRITLADGTVLEARRVLVATGVVDVLPDITGLAERWGKDVIHCPYCHGWEVRDQPIGVLASPGRTVHQALLFRQLSRDVMVFAQPDDLTGQERERLSARGIRIIEGKIVGVRAENDRLSGIELADGRVIPRGAVVLAPRQAVDADFLADLDLHPVQHPSGSGQHLAADPLGRAGVPGIWLAGNVTDPFAQVGAAAAAGALAGAQINADLVTEETDAAVAALRDPFSAASEAKVSELVTGGSRHGM